MTTVIIQTSHYKRQSDTSVQGFIVQDPCLISWLLSLAFWWMASRHLSHPTNEEHITRFKYYTASYNRPIISSDPLIAHWRIIRSYFLALSFPFSFAIHITLLELTAFYVIQARNWGQTERCFGLQGGTFYPVFQKRKLPCQKNGAQGESVKNTTEATG